MTREIGETPDYVMTGSNCSVLHIAVDNSWHTLCRQVTPDSKYLRGLGTQELKYLDPNPNFSLCSHCRRELKKEDNILKRVDGEEVVKLLREKELLEKESQS